MLEIYDYNGEGYKPLHDFGAWRVAFLNYADRFDQKNLEQMERHLETDEVFILLSGTARLIIGEELTLYPMEPNKVYNVPKNVWHHIQVLPGSTVAITENQDTGLDNTEYWDVPEEQAKQVTSRAL